MSDKSYRPEETLNVDEYIAKQNKMECDGYD